MKEVVVSSKAIPASPRSKNYPTGATIVHTSGGGTTVIQPSTGSDVDIIKTTDSKSATDKNVLSALKALAEFISKTNDDSVKGIIDFLQGIKLQGKSLTDIILKGEAISPSDGNVFSSLRTLYEILSNNEELKKIFLRKDQSDQTEHLLKLLGGAIIEQGLTADTILVKSDLTARQLKSAISSALTEEGDISDVISVSLIEEGDGNETVMSTALLEEAADGGFGSGTLGELTNVSPSADDSPNGSLLVSDNKTWTPVPPAISPLNDFDNMLMPVFHKVLGKWIFISVSSISGGVTPPVVLDMILDSGILNRDTLSDYDDSITFGLDNSTELNKLAQHG